MRVLRWSTGLLALASLVWAQPAQTPQEQFVQCQWEVRQLRDGREQAERRVAILGAQLEKLQAELDKVKADKAPDKLE